MRRADSFEKTLMVGKIEGRRRRGRQRIRWLDGITDLMDVVHSLPVVNQPERNITRVTVTGGMKAF